VLGLLAEKLEPTVSEESQIEAAVTALENSPIKPADYAAFVQKEGDRRVNDALKKKDPPKPADPKDSPKPADPQDPLATVLQEISKLNDKIGQLEKGNAQKSLTEQLHAKLKEKKIPLQLAAHLKLESADELDNVVAGLETDYNAMLGELKASGTLGSLPKPGGGIQSPADSSDEKAVDADIKAWAAKGEKKTT
jgi:hypothetical protein